MSAKLRKQNPEPTNDLKTALLACKGKRVVFKGTPYKIDVGYLDRDQLRFFCYAENLAPKTPEEAKFCLWDVWSSDTDLSGEFVAKLAVVGGFV